MNKLGKIAESCGYELELQVCKSGAGYYIGTWDSLEGPISRESVEYYKTQSEAKKALETGTWTQRK